MFTFYVRENAGQFYVENIFTGGRSQMYSSKADADAVRDWLQFNA